MTNHGRRPGAPRVRRETPEKFRIRLLSELRQERESLARQHEALTKRIEGIEQAEAALNIELES